MILAIETTCDETSAAVVRGNAKGVEVLSNVIASSSEMHEKYGGIVPEVAAREQVKSIIPVVKEAMKKAKVKMENLEVIAVAYGPGLMGSLLIGVETAKTLAYVWNKPLIKVNHMEGHMFANWIVQTPSALRASPPWQGEIRMPPELPAVALVVSGGHTDLIYLKSIEDWEWLGGTRDDAAGECFDKCARILGVPYPGGPAIERTAQSVMNDENLVVNKLPRPMMDQDTYEMSFSGLKSAVVNQFGELSNKNPEKLRETIPYLAKEINEAVVEVLIEKTMKAVNSYRPKSVLLAGGVAANVLLRKEFKHALKTPSAFHASPPWLGEIKLYVPEMKYCTDNAAMIGAAALIKPMKADPLVLRPEPGL